jgi:adenylyltransferase/sulfurtransferase
LVFADPDRVEASNLPRQTLFTPADVGRSKVEAAARTLAQANPWIRLEPSAQRVEPSNVRALVEDADLVIDGTDNFATKFLVHDACRSAAKPLVLASLYQWEAQVTVFPFHQGALGCWRCLYPVAPVDGCVGVCADVGVAGALAGLAGNAQALAAVRLLLGLPGAEPLTTWVYDAAEPMPRRLKWKVDPGCSCHRGPGDWSWLEQAVYQGRTEAFWPQVSADDRQVVVDVRELHEIEPAQWAWFEAQGSRVIHFPWSEWSFRQPDWESDTSYLVVCARGYRSLAAVETIPPGIRALSLTGGVFALPL